MVGVRGLKEFREYKEFREVRDYREIREIREIRVFSLTYLCSLISLNSPKSPKSPKFSNFSNFPKTPYLYFLAEVGCYIKQQGLHVGGLDDISYAMVDYSTYSYALDSLTGQYAELTTSQRLLASFADTITRTPIFSQFHFVETIGSENVQS